MVLQDCYLLLSCLFATDGLFFEIQRTRMLESATTYFWAKSNREGFSFQVPLLFRFGNGFSPESNEIRLPSKQNSGGGVLPQTKFAI